MKITDKKELKKNESLSLKKIRELEKKLGVYITKPQNPLRDASDGYDIFDEDEKPAGFVSSKLGEPFRNKEELERAVLLLSAWRK
jgi:hypothetical protein